MNGILVVCAHHDDETLGMGGTLATLADFGTTVAVLGDGPICRMNDGEEVTAIRDHWHRACDLLGVYDQASWLTFPDQKFDTVPLLDIVQHVEMLIDKYRPSEVYTHHAGDLNRDHRVVHEAVLVATRPTPGQTVKRVYSFEVPSSTEWHFGSGQPFTPNVFQPLARDALDRKIKAMQCYETEIRESPHPRSPEVLEAIARRWGSVCGHEYAEAFMLVREIR